jgi:hypothetical protein
VRAVAEPATAHEQVPVPSNDDATSSPGHAPRCATASVSQAARRPGSAESAAVPNSASSGVFPRASAQRRNGATTSPSDRQAAGLPGAQPYPL